VVSVCGDDQHRIEIDANDAVTECVEKCSNTPRATSSVEDPRRAGCQGVN
jgi:hypothetical protein